MNNKAQNVPGSIDAQLLAFKKAQQEALTAASKLSGAILVTLGEYFRAIVATGIPGIPSLENLTAFAQGRLPELINSALGDDDLLSDRARLAGFLVHEAMNGKSDALSASSIAVSPETAESPEAVASELEFDPAHPPGAIERVPTTIRHLESDSSPPPVTFPATPFPLPPPETSKTNAPVWEITPAQFQLLVEALEPRKEVLPADAYADMLEFFHQGIPSERYYPLIRHEMAILTRIRDLVNPSLSPKAFRERILDWLHNQMDPQTTAPTSANTGTSLTKEARLRALFDEHLPPNQAHFMEAVFLGDANGNCLSVPEAGKLYSRNRTAADADFLAAKHTIAAALGHKPEIVKLGKEAFLKIIASGRGELWHGHRHRP